MATSKCPKCDLAKFEVKQNYPAHSKTSITFIQCISCGAVVGVLNNLDKLEEKLGSIDKDLWNLKYR